MRWAVDATLLEKASRILGTLTLEETIEESLRRTVETRRAAGTVVVAGLRARKTELRAFPERLHTLQGDDELARRRAGGQAGQAMDQVRVRMGRDCNVVYEIRETRDRSAAGSQQGRERGG